MKLPKEVNEVIKTLEGAGFEAYVVGGCVRDLLRGKEPADWDITCSASLEEITRLFPKALVIGRKFGVAKVITSELAADVATFRIDGKYSDYRRPDEVVYTKSIEEDLKRRDFTINAIAANEEIGIIDPYFGRDDIDAGVIRTVGDSNERFEEDPLRILRGIRFSAQFDFEIQPDTFYAMRENAYLLDKISIERIQEEFIKTITSNNAGKGLKTFTECNVLPYILGKSCIENAAKHEMDVLKALAENIDKTEADKKYRLALIYMCFEKESAFKAIRRMTFDNEMKEMMECALIYSSELSLIEDGTELKKFILSRGYSVYYYLEKLLKQQSLVYDLPQDKMQNRIAILDEIKRYRQPVLIEDLAVNGKDLKQIGIVQGETLGRMLKMLIYYVHKNPSKNNKEDLLKKAEECKD